MDMLKYSDGISSEDSKANQKYFIELDEVKMKYLAFFHKNDSKKKKKSSFSLPIIAISKIGELKNHPLLFKSPLSTPPIETKKGGRENNETISTFDRDRSTRNYPR